MEDALAKLRLDSDDYADAQDSPPVFRSAANAAFSSWATAADDGWPVPNADADYPWPCPGPDTDDIKGGVLNSASLTRCVPADSWDLHDVQAGLLDAPPPRLSATLAPHRIEGNGPSEELLVCSLRHFSVTVQLLDGTTGAPLMWDTPLRASLVFADSGEPVPAQRGEPPLSGETEGKRPCNGECVLRLRATALSYHHNRRPFAVRVDADALPGTAGGGFACSAPMRAVARLPNESKSSSKPAASASAACAPAGATPCVAAAVTAAPADSPTTMAVQPSGVQPSGVQPSVQQSVQHSGAWAAQAPSWATPTAAPAPVHTAAAPTRIAPPTTTTIAVLDDSPDEDDDGLYDEEDDDECMLVEESVAQLPPSCAQHACAQHTAAYTYTSHMDLVDELKVQGDMLQRVSAQQHFILSELARMNGISMPPAMQPVAPWSRTTCV